MVFLVQFADRFADPDPSPGALFDHPVTIELVLDSPVKAPVSVLVIGNRD
jgi:hypothetical protein